MSIISVLADPPEDLVMLSSLKMCVSVFECQAELCVVFSWQHWDREIVLLIPDLTHVQLNITNSSD